MRKLSREETTMHSVLTLYVLLKLDFRLSGLIGSTSQCLNGTGSIQNGPACGSKPLSSPAPVDQSAGIWEVVAGKIHMRNKTFP